MIKRSIQPFLLRLAKMYPVVSVTGPRQSGKTTLIKNTFTRYEYLNLEDERIRTFGKIIGCKLRTIGELFKLIKKFGY